ncbi:hypothetical protein H4W26_002671 [Nesterenkonia halotolerans]|uniref:Transposase n=1 Tax=Nesterenkonia halotolerans TaxID=225325 RepID=A0ABR9JAK3_9MICC|nr:hypothetical protein [Nesterenkonia halotolerans]
MRGRPLMVKEIADSFTTHERSATGAEWLEAAEASATGLPNSSPNRATSNEVASIDVTWVWITRDGDAIIDPQTAGCTTSTPRKGTRENGW